VNAAQKLRRINVSIPTAEITQNGNTAFDKEKPLMIGAVLSLPESVRVDKPFVQ